jgi:hypothetical protein
VLQRAENLTDRMAAEAVRARLDWKYLLGLSLDDPGFDHSVLPEFRAKVAGAGLERAALDALLERLASDGLVKAGGKQRTDSTHVIAAVAALNRLELAGESVRAALEALAAAHPGWTAQVLHVGEWNRRYGTPVTSWRPPVSETKRNELAVTYARDGFALLEAVGHPASPAWLRELPAVETLRLVLLQNYTRTVHSGGREVIKRREKAPEGDGLPPGHRRIASPYDTDARPRPPAASRTRASRSGLTTPAGPASRAPWPRPSVTAPAEPATAGFRKQASTMPSWPSPSTSSASTPTGAAGPSTGREPATSLASNSASPHNRINHQGRVQAQNGAARQGAPWRAAVLAVAGVRPWCAAGAGPGRVAGGGRRGRRGRRCG